MSSTDISRNDKLTFGNNKIDIKVVHNPKAPSTQLLLTFKTTEIELLDELLKKFKYEKFISVGANLNNKADQIICKNGCIYAILPEAKVFTFTVVVYKALMTSSLKSAVIKNNLCKNQSYSKLHKDIKSFQMVITGKAKHICTKLQEKGKPIDAFKTAIQSIEAKDIPDIKIAKPGTYYQMIDASGSDLAKLYFVIFCQQFDFFYVDKNKILVSEATYAEMKNFIAVNGDSARGLIVNFYKQCGGALTDKLTVKRINVILSMIAELHGISSVPVKEGTWTIDTKALAEMKHMLK